MTNSLNEAEKRIQAMTPKEFAEAVGKAKDDPIAIDELHAARARTLPEDHAPQPVPKCESMNREGTLNIAVSPSGKFVRLTYWLADGTGTMHLDIPPGGALSTARQIIARAKEVIESQGDVVT